MIDRKSKRKAKIVNHIVYSIQKQFKICIQELIDALNPWVAPKPEDLVLKLVTHTARLALQKGENVLFAPIRGTHGPIQLSGNSLPVFSYTMFEEEMMEFINVRVEVSLPNRVEYSASINSVTAPERNGDKIEMKVWYQEPFQILSHHLYQYFPLYKPMRDNHDL